MKKKLFFMSFVIATFFACNDSTEFSESLQSEIIETPSTTSTMQKAQNSFDGVWFHSTRYFGKNLNTNNIWTPYLEYAEYESGNHKFAITQNVRGAGNVSGHQTISAHRPVDGYYYHHMQLWIDKSSIGPNDCLAYPKIKCYPFAADKFGGAYLVNKGKRLNQYSNITARVHARTPHFQQYNRGTGWPTGNPIHYWGYGAEERQFNLAFDIYFDKPNQDVTTNYAAVMIWLAWESNWGPAGDWIANRWVDGVEYDVRACKNFASCEYQINYCRKNKSVMVDNVNIKAVLDDIQKMGWRGVNLNDKILSNINIGFEIFAAKGNDANRFFAIDKYNLNMTAN